MTSLNNLADEFCDLVKEADENYSVIDKTEALITNLKQIHHQIKNAGIEFDNTEAFEHIQAALHKISGAVRDMEVVRSLGA